MAQVDIEVNARIYKVTCEDGQEERLQQLAGHIDRHVGDLAEELGQIGDARLMLLAALTVCDELYDSKARCASLENGADELDTETLGGASRVIEAAAKRIETMSERISEAS